MKALLVCLHMRMMLACCLVTVPSWPPSFSVQSIQSCSVFSTRFLVLIQPIIFEDWYQKSAIVRLLKIDSFLSRLSK